MSDDASPRAVARHPDLFVVAQLVQPRVASRPIHSISVLIPTFNGERFLERVLAALAGQRLDVPWDFLAIDSGSTDRTLAILESWKARFPVPLRIEHIHPSAFNHGDTRNLLAAQSRGDLLVFLTQDAIPSSPLWLATLAKNFDDASVGAAYCRNLVRPDADLLTLVFSENDPGYTSGRREVCLSDSAAYAAFSAHEKRLLYNFNDVASALRRELWERHPLPRTAFGEDVLLARALLEAGYTVVYDDVATVEHSHDYDAAETKKRCTIDGRFNAEWLDRVCVGSRSDAEVLVERQLARDCEALKHADVRGDQLAEQLAHAKELRRAAFVGLYEGGLSKKRFPATRMRDTGQLHVLYVVHGFPPDTWAGTEVYTLGLALEMQRRGHGVTILTRAPAATPVAEGGPAEFSLARGDFQGLEVWRMTHRLQHGSVRESYHQPGAEAAFRDVLLRVRPDVVHFQHLLHLSAGLPHVARELGVPSIITVHDYWAMCARVQFIRPDGVRCEENQGLGCLLCVGNKSYKQIPAAKRLLPVLEPLVSMLRGAGGVPGMAKIAQAAGAMRDMAARHEFVVGRYAACERVIAPSRFLRQKLLDTGAFDPHEVLYSDNGTLTDNVRAIEKRPDPEGRVRFGFVGSLVWYKGVDVLVRAMGRLAGARAVLHVWGEFEPDRDPHHAELGRLAREGGGAVVFHGRFDNAKIADVYEQLDVLVVPSVWFENSPVTIHESMLFRTPLVVSNIGGMAELVRDGVDGLHFKVGDDADLAHVLKRCVDEPDLIERLSQSFPRIKTMAEDARETEARYRGLACIVRERQARTLLDQPGTGASLREGPVEQQGADMLLVRPGGAIEFDASTLRPGSLVVRVDLFALASETGVPLGGRVLVDGSLIGLIERFCGVPADQTRSFELAFELAADARRLRLESHDLTLRVARVVVREAPADKLASVPA